MINSMEFTFGLGEGQYPITGFVTDSVFTVARATGIGYGTQYYSSDITQGDRSLYYGDIFTPVEGDKMRVYFENPLIMQNA